MVTKKGTALLVVYADVDVEHDAEFNAWYNEEHVPERLSARGSWTLPATRPCAAARAIWQCTSWSRWTPCRLPSTGT